jgi:hypothetical protein
LDNIKKTALTLMAAMMILPTAFGASKAKSTTETETINKTETTKEIRAYERVVVYESMKNRMDKKFSLNAAIGGLAYSTTSTAFEGSYFLKPNMLVTLQYSKLGGTSENTDNDTAADEVWKRDGLGHVFSAGIKKFESNSFYYKPEIYSRTQEFVHSTSSNSTELFSKETAFINDIGVSFKIGNQWQWESFTLGCDWIGITRSMTASKISSNIYSYEKNSTTLLNFYMGASF